MTLLDEMTKEIFMELLRAYHNGIGVSHDSDEPDKVSRDLAKQAQLMAEEYRRTIDEKYFS